MHRLFVGVDEPRAIAVIGPVLQNEQHYTPDPALWADLPPANQQNCPLRIDVVFTGG